MSLFPQESMLNASAERAAVLGLVGRGFVRVVVERGIEQLGMVGNEGLTYVLAEGVSARVGQRVKVPLGRGKHKLVGGFVVATGGAELAAGLAARSVRTVARVEDETLPAELVGLARWLAEYYVCPMGMVLAAMMPAAAKKVVGKKQVAKCEVASAIVPASHSPTADQQRVIDGIAASLGGFGVHLLRGVTGSGKTEVYVRVLERVLARGQNAIVLVPEIALTPQTAGRFVERFGSEAVAVLHSGLTGAQRARAWRRLAEGSARVALGARSGVFAPLANVGLIVVDEEHDSSYKQDQLPRYHGRDVAIKRGQLCGATVVLGSATPSLESWSNAMRGTGSVWKLWELKERVGGGVLPRVTLLDMREERRRAALDPTREQRRVHMLGPTLEAALERVLRSEAGQALLLLNRRGFAHYLACPKSACGFVQQCAACDAALVLHKDVRTPGGRVVRCHHCHVEQKVATLCPACGAVMVALGGGTQRLEEELERKFAALGLASGSTLLRVDSDTMSSAREYFKTLASFAAGEARVLVGTQMIAKGLDFPRVNLVGIVDADTALALPDFRATERTFQLVSQAAGRAGRASAAGEVLVQSYTPGIAALRFAAEHDFVGFAREELAQRVESGLPPARRMARIVCREAVHAKAWDRCGKIAAALRLVVTPGDVVGPMDCAIARIAGKFRVGIEVLANDAGVLRAALSRVREAGLVKSDASTAVDVDPVALL